MRLIEIFENQEDEAEPQYKREMTEEQFFEFMNNSGGIYDWILEMPRPPIWRGSYEGFDTAFINPRVKGRTSAHTTNFYTVFTSNHPSWSQFPPRNASMICATDRTLASGHGEPYVVLLPENARVAVCPKDDFWDSFLVIGKNVPRLRGPKELNDLITALSKHTDYYENNITDYGDLVKLFEQLDEILAGNRESEPGSWYQPTYQWFQSQHDAGKSFMEIYTTLMDPQSNGFSITTANDPALAKNQYREVWSDSDCVMVTPRSWDEYQMIGKK